MAMRKGLGKGKGKGYKNLAGRDPKIHSDSSKGRKQPQKMPFIKEPYGLPFELQQKDKFKNPKNTKPQEIETLLKDMMEKKDEEFDKIMGSDYTKKYGKSKSFDDVKIYTDKEMSHEYNKDPSKGWTGTMSGIAPKKKDSNVVLLVTYDGAGYESFSVNEGAVLTEKFQKMLDKKFGKEKYSIEHETNWAFSVYKE